VVAIPTVASENLITDCGRDCNYASLVLFARSMNTRTAASRTKTMHPFGGFTRLVAPQSGQCGIASPQHRYRTPADKNPDS
jgi:hypothetical protein